MQMRDLCGAQLHKNADSSPTSSALTGRGTSPAPPQAGLKRFYFFICLQLTFLGGAVHFTPWKNIPKPCIWFSKCGHVSDIWIPGCSAFPWDEGVRHIVLALLPFLLRGQRV